MSPIRPPKGKRAGTKIDPDHTVRIWGIGKSGRKLHGLLDAKSRVYQCGGERKNFVYWAKKMITMDVDAWRQVYLDADWLEFVDHDRNEVYRIEVEVALNYVEVYNAGIGDRAGFPLAAFERRDAEGRILDAPTLTGRRFL